jgi:hypothetical protein
VPVGRSVGFATVSAQLLSLLKFPLLALLYLFLFRVVRAVWAELSPPAREPAGDAAPANRRRSGRHTAVPSAEPPSGAVATLPAPAAAPVGAATRPAPAPAGGALVVVAPAELAGRRHELGSGELTVGRGGGCSVVLDDTYVSQLHARLYVADGRWMVEDLGSTNGTWLNGERVGGVRPVGRGDHLALGGVVLEMQ